MKFDFCMQKQIRNEGNAHFENIFQAQYTMATSAIECDKTFFACRKMDLIVKNTWKKEKHDVSMAKHFNELKKQIADTTEILADIDRKRHPLITQPEIFEKSTKHHAIIKSTDCKLLTKRKALTAVANVIGTQQKNHQKKMLRWKTSLQTYSGILDDVKDRIKQESAEQKQKLECLSIESNKAIKVRKSFYLFESDKQPCIQVIDNYLALGT